MGRTASNPGKLVARATAVSAACAARGRSIRPAFSDLAESAKTSSFQYPALSEIQSLPALPASATGLP